MDDDATDMCIFCDPDPPIGVYPGRAPHPECGLRSAVGGIGHLTNHAYWCGQMHDPDAGLSPRESARQVWAWIQDNGVDAAVAVAEEAAGDGS